MTHDKFGDVLKQYESVETQRIADPTKPVLARLDGRSFHAFTRGFPRPYCKQIQRWMESTTAYLVKETQASIGYTQSDEISLAWELSHDRAQYLFGGKFHKLTSVLAAMCSVKFYQEMLFDRPDLAQRIPTFDCRVWQVPNLEIAADMFRWREADAIKNSITMAASSVFAHRELQGKHSGDKLQMLIDKGINWEQDYPSHFKRGLYLQRRPVREYLTREQLDKIPIDKRPKGGIVDRSKVERVSMPSAKYVSNYVDVLFRVSLPKLRE